jgi:tRNA/tmRNA/rRNA uracil-C5-methylase (TrmA/RlmC/RlmD family)
VALLPSKEQTKVSYISKNAADMVQHEKVFSSNKAEILVVDPPRKGLEEEVCTALCTSKNTKLLVYVSCGFDAFQRDCKALLESGKWVLEHAQGHLLFPGSDAIETLAFFVRK